MVMFLLAAFVTRDHLCPVPSMRRVRMSFIELQESCGRGHEHLSARLEVGDVCVYQTGTWMVDWVPVGPGLSPRLLLARVDVVQIDWTTDCEHGRIIGTPISSVEGNNVYINPSEEFGAVQVSIRIAFRSFRAHKPSQHSLLTPSLLVQFGPEQLVARVQAEWIDDLSANLLAPLPSSLRANLPEPEWLPVEASEMRVSD